ncbi:MAG: AraC family transcriptional regulator [Eubacteriales bacterium]|nr:AraC family transcriptional regulator [Eubacteriales bacterium]
MKEYPHYLFKSFAKTTGLCVRLYQDRQLVYHYSPTHMLPDPVKAQLAALFSDRRRAGVLLTPLYQYYGYAQLDHDSMLVVGPTAVLKEDDVEMESLTFLLGVPTEEKELYRRSLCCAPQVSAEQLAWMLSFFITALDGQVFGVEQVHIQTDSGRPERAIAQAYTAQAFDAYEDSVLNEEVLRSYRFECLANHYITNGQVEQLHDLLEKSSATKAGAMAKDVLRQHKNMFICAAATFSRAAIGGGLEPQAAFKLSDLYIQKCELLREPSAVMTLIPEMALDFAARVRVLNYGSALDSKLFEDCALYVKQHLFSRILVKDMAERLRMSSTYLSTRFHAVTGKTLSQFILEQKINEAKQLLRYADKSMADIAMHLAFSSQSHFQNAFKKQVAMTPLEYRRQLN